MNMIREKDDTGVVARFYMKAKHLPAKSLKEGRPIFEEREYVEITIPGDTKTLVDREVKEEDKQRWPNAYDAFRKGVEFHGEGTPLNEWPQLSVSQIATMKALNIHTVEALANLPDSGLDRIGMGARALQKAAKAYIESAEDTALASEQAVKLEAQEREIEMLKQQIKDLASQIEGGVGVVAEPVAVEVQKVEVVSEDKPVRTKVHLGRGKYKVFEGDEIIAEKVDRQEAERLCEE